MVVTVTLNPLLERRFFTGNFRKGKTHRIAKTDLTAGGKGINVSRELNLLGIKNLAVLPIGGLNGKAYRNVLEKERINYFAISVKSEMRDASLIIEDEKSVTSFIGPNVEISESDINKFSDKIKKVYENSSVILFAGSVPNEKSAKIICDGINSGNNQDKITFLDTYGKHLQQCLDASPFAVHNTVSEIETSLKLKLNSEKEKIDFLKNLYSKGIKLAFLTEGENPIYAMKFGYLYKIYPPEIEPIDATGCGDVFVAGIIHGLEKDNVFGDFVKYATALATKNAMKIETAEVSFEEIKELLPKIKIEEIGPKMKIIDDSPNYR